MGERQVRREYKVDQPELRPPRDYVHELAKEFERFLIRHVSRDENWGADELGEVSFSD